MTSPLARIQDPFHIPDSLKREFSAHELAEFVDQFKAFDTSGDGAIDVDELTKMMNSMNVKIDHAEAQQLILLVDENNSGQIEFNEFVRMMSNLRRGKSNKLSKFMQLAKQAFNIRKEYRETLDDPIDGCTIVPFPKDMRQWDVYIDGPTDSPYQAGCFKFHFEFGHEYPYEPPSVRLLTRIYHLNFVMLADGTSSFQCLEQLWTPDWRSRDLIIKIQELLIDPDPGLMEEIYNSAEARLEIQGLRYSGTTLRSFGLECLRLFRTDRITYEERAMQVTEECAKKHNMTIPQASSDTSERK